MDAYARGEVGARGTRSTNPKVTPVRVSMIQLAVEASESADERRRRAAGAVRSRAGDDLVVLPELWTAGARAYDRWDQDAEPLDGPTAEAMSAAARHAGTWLHAGSTSTVADPWGELLAEAGRDEQAVTADVDMAEVLRIRSALPVLRDRVLGVAPGSRTLTGATGSR